MAFYRATGGPSWDHRHGWATKKNVCRWYGVICSGGHVAGVALVGNGLTGAVPASRRKLSGLTVLNLSDNRLTSIPSVTRLKKLWLLDLSGNSSPSFRPPSGASGNCGSWSCLTTT